jgi:hypothetical protein
VGCEIREKCHREVAAGIEGNASNLVAGRRTEENREQKAGEGENEVPKSLPEWSLI